MKRHVAPLFGLFLVSTLLMGVAHSQTLQSQLRPQATPPLPLPPPHPSPSPASVQGPSVQPFYLTIWQLELWTWDLWRMVLVSLGAGAFGGLVYHLMSFREIQEILRQEAERDGRKVSPIARISSCLSHVSMGAAVAPPAILLLRPETAFALVAMSIVTGAVGSAIVRNVQERMLANLNAERANTDRVKAEHEVTRQIALRFNAEQALAVKHLIEIVNRHASEPGDWYEVRRIAGNLVQINEDCQNTFHQTGGVTSDSNLPPTSLAVANKALLPQNHAATEGGVAPKARKNNSG